MPQQELWAASARPTGFSFIYETPEKRLSEEGLVTVRPTWSKRPSGRDGVSHLTVPDFAVWSLPEVFRAAFEQYLGGDPKHVGTSARVALRDVLTDFADGVRM